MFVLHKISALGEVRFTLTQTAGRRYERGKFACGRPNHGAYERNFPSLIKWESAQKFGAGLDRVCYLRSADLQIHRDRSLFTFPDLKLNGIALVQILDLISRREAAAVKKHVFAAVIRSDKAKALLAYDFFDRACHWIRLLSQLCLLFIIVM
jgi:hypothetical protein